MPKKRGRSYGLRGRNLVSYHLGPLDGSMPISRRVLTRRTKRVVGGFLSVKMQSTLPWESQIERDYFYCLEFNHDVRAFAAQPSCLNLLVDGLPRRHFPDLLVQYHSGATEYHEVKTDRDAVAPENLALFEAARLHCAQASIVYRVVPESEIRQQPRLANCQTLMHHRRKTVNLEDELKIVSALTKGPLVYEDLQRLLMSNANPSEVILALTAHRKIRFCLNTALNAQTPFLLTTKP
jgi:hypothetical protein